jgi:hypothetical protein
MKDKKRILLISSLAILPFTFVLFQLTTLWLGPKWGYITGFLGYWAYCLITAWVLSGSDWNYFRWMWTEQREGKSLRWISLVAFLPVFGVFFVSFLPNVGFFLSLLLFGAWHISLWFARGILYKDGFLALVGGAYGLGLIWTWVARSNGNLRAVVPSHILVNLFAMTALFVSNGF